MANASGVAKTVRYKEQPTAATAPGASGAQLLRRVDSSLDMNRENFQSEEIRPDYQDSDFRLGTKKIEGSINGELSPKTYADFFGAALRRNFAAVTAITGASITIAVGSIVNGVQQYTVTRGAGSFLTDGVKIADVIRLSVGGFNANNLSKNIFVVSMTATVLTVQTLSPKTLTLTAEGPIITSTVTVVGKKTFAPVTGHTNKMFMFEHWFSDIAQSEQFLDCKISTIDVDLPATGLTKFSMTVMGLDLVTGTAQYYTSPTAATTTGVAAAVNGILLIAGVPVAVCTALKFKIEGGHSGDAVVGSDSMPEMFPGKVLVTGEFSCYFVDGTFRDNFKNETEMALATVLTSDNTAASDFIGFSFSRLKLTGSSKSDGTKGIIQTFPFKALLNNVGGTGTSTEQTTMSIQDSAA